MIVRKACLQSFDGYQKRFEHASKACSCDMTFSVFFPPAAEKGKVPVSAAGPLLEVGACAGIDSEALMTRSAISGHLLPPWTHLHRRDVSAEGGTAPVKHIVGRRRSLRMFCDIKFNLPAILTEPGRPSCTGFSTAEGSRAGRCTGVHRHIAAWSEHPGVFSTRAHLLTAGSVVGP